jgi:hypothetical protein
MVVMVHYIAVAMPRVRTMCTGLMMRHAVEQVYFFEGEAIVFFS